MPDILNSTPFTDRLNELEKKRDSKAILLAAVNLDMDLLAPLYEVIKALPNKCPLDVVFYSRGGVVNAARRIALLLHEYFPQIRFLIPHYCESAGTITILSADEVIAGPVAIFSPIDPILSASGAEDGPSAMSVQDLRLFNRMSQDWFGLEEKEAAEHALNTLCENIFPSTLTSFHRCTQELEHICEQLLCFPFPDNSSKRRDITQHLIYGYHSHSYAISGEELAELGLPIRKPDNELENLMWSLGQKLRQQLGAGNRTNETDHWYDALILSAQGGLVQQRSLAQASRWLSWAQISEQGSHD